MIILGIDPGIAATGYGVIKAAPYNKLSMIDYGCIRTAKEHAHAKRLLKIYQELKKVIKKHHPVKIAIENIYFAKNVKTAMRVSEARGIATLIAAENKIEVFEFTPLQVKQALTGYGRATKAQIQKIVKSVLKLDKIPRPNDAADALAIAITCAQTRTFDI